MMRSQVRGFKIKKHLIPIQFEYGTSNFSTSGQQAARQLAHCLQQNCSGQAERESLQLNNPENYTQEEIYALNRRVEVKNLQG
jgi:hypothetical protein